MPTLFMDNARFHCTKIVNQFFKDNGDDTQWTCGTIDNVLSGLDEVFELIYNTVGTLNFDTEVVLNAVSSGTKAQLNFLIFPYIIDSSTITHNHIYLVYLI